MRNIKVTDTIRQRDVVESSSTQNPIFEMNKHKGFRTQIDVRDDFGQLLFSTENRLVLGGALFTLEKLFGVPSPVKVDYLNDILGIATGGPNVTELYPKDTVVCLFGVGTGGAGDTITSVHDVSVTEREILEPIPFRYTDSLTSEEEEKYWFAHPDGDTGKTAYYLKKFELTPEIRVLWDDAENDEDGTPVQSGVHTSTRTDEIETFVELTLRIDKKDLREWFEHNGEIEKARFNTIGLFTGILSDVGDGKLDYKQVKMFSKFNIHNEMLALSKGLTITYRIYTT